MGDPHSPVKPGPLTEPLSPEEMWRQAVQSQRGFLSSPSGSEDQYRQQPATLPSGAAAGDKGSPVGKGYETFGGIQVLDKDGRRAAFGADYFDGGGVDNHAEARIIRGLEKNGPATVPGGRIIVVVEKDLCASCEARIRAYAQRIGAREVEIHVPQRESLQQAGQMVTPKTAARTSFRAVDKPTVIRKLRSISLSSGPETPPTSGSKTPAMISSRSRFSGMARGAGGAVFDIVLSLILDLIAAKFMEYLDRKKFEEKLRALEPKINEKKREVYLAFMREFGSRELGPLYYNIKISVTTTTIIVIAGSGSRNIPVLTIDLLSVVISNADINIAGEAYEKNETASQKFGVSAPVIYNTLTQFLTYSEPVNPF